MTQREALIEADELLLARVERVEFELFMLAANLCEAPGSDEYGNRECQTIKTLRAELAKVMGERDRDIRSGLFLR